MQFPCRPRHNKKTGWYVNCFCHPHTISFPVISTIQPPHCSASKTRESIVSTTSDSRVCKLAVCRVSPSNSLSLLSWQALEQIHLFCKLDNGWLAEVLQQSGPLKQSLPQWRFNVLVFADRHKEMFVPPICCSALSRLSLSLVIPCACLSGRYPLIAIGTPRRTSSHYSFTGKAILGIASSLARPSAKYIVHPLFKLSDHQLWVTRSKQMTSRPSVYKVDLSTIKSSLALCSVVVVANSSPFILFSSSRVTIVSEHSRQIVVVLLYRAEWFTILETSRRTRS